MYLVSLTKTFAPSRAPMPEMMLIVPTISSRSPQQDSACTSEQPPCLTAAAIGYQTLMPASTSETGSSDSLSLFGGRAMTGAPGDNPDRPSVTRDLQSQHQN